MYEFCVFWIFSNYFLLGRNGCNKFYFVFSFWSRPIGFGFLDVANNCVAYFDPPGVEKRYHLLFYLTHAVYLSQLFPIIPYYDYSVL